MISSSSLGAGTGPGPVVGKAAVSASGPQPSTQGGGNAENVLTQAFSELIAALTGAAEQTAASEEAPVAVDLPPEADTTVEDAEAQPLDEAAQEASDTVAAVPIPARDGAEAKKTGSEAQTPTSTPVQTQAQTQTQGQAQQISDANPAAKVAGQPAVPPAPLTANQQPQHVHTHARFEKAEVTEALRQAAGVASNPSQPPQLAATRQDNAKELLTFSLPAQRGTSQSVTPTSTGAELRLDTVQQLARPGQAEWAPVKVDTQNSQWSRDLVAALGERLSMQVNQNVKEATVRLDPPDLGRIELVVRMDGDRLNVQLSASNAGIRDLLTQHAERLRNELMQQNLQTVDVQVGQQSQRDNSRHSQPEPEIIAPSLFREPEQDAVADENNNRWLSTSA